jgi:glycosyltransferase involved in cell wall biosynthesis
VSAELLVVIPVLNEERSVSAVLDEWTAELDRSDIEYSILRLDDGSTDSTPKVLSD